MGNKSPKNLTEQYNMRVDRETKAMSRRAKSLGLPHLKEIRKLIKKYYKEVLNEVEPGTTTLIPGSTKRQVS